MKKHIKDIKLIDAIAIIGNLEVDFKLEELNLFEIKAIYKVYNFFSWISAIMAILGIGFAIFIGVIKASNYWIISLMLLCGIATYFVLNLWKCLHIIFFCKVHFKKLIKNQKPV